MNAINRVQKRKQALAGYMRIGVESSNGAWCELFWSLDRLTS